MAALCDDLEELSIEPTGAYEYPISLRGELACESLHFAVTPFCHSRRRPDYVLESGTTIRHITSHHEPEGEVVPKRDVYQIYKLLKPLINLLRPTLKLMKTLDLDWDVETMNTKVQEAKERQTE